MPYLTTCIVVSGLPASGKTSLAGALAKRLGLEHLDKDRFLEAWLTELPVRRPQDRTHLSRRADAVFQAQALGRSAAVLSSWWRHPHSTRDSGTPVAWLLKPGRKVVEIHCQCTVAEAVRRFRARSRHPGHLDGLRSAEELLAQFEEAQTLGPLMPSQAIVCDTSSPISEDAVAALAVKVCQRLAVGSVAGE